MNNSNDMICQLPKMKAGEELRNALKDIPVYDDEIRAENEAIRLMKLSEIYNIYLPTEMSLEIYSKLYLAMLRSLQKKNSKLATQQRISNFRGMQTNCYSGIIGGADSFTIIGSSGIGKSSAIARAISLITEDKIIEVENPFVQIIPCVACQCPFDSSVKGLLLEVLRKVDESIGSSYYEKAVKARATTDMLIGNVSQVALNHVGLLIVDEIQNICNGKHGKRLVAMLTQLINNSGISICMVGTPESSNFFEQEMQLARRSLGLRYNTMPYDVDFKRFCETVFSFQYVRSRTQLTDSIIEWLYEHSGGIISIVVSLIHDAQEIAILEGKEILNLSTLNDAYQKRLNMLHEFISPSIVVNQQTSKPIKKSFISQQSKVEVVEDDSANNIVDLANRAKKNKEDILTLLKERFSVTEVYI